MRSGYREISEFVEQVNIRNTGLAVTNLQGISINKYFMPSVANINGTDLAKYKIVKQKQFAFNPMHVGRDEVLPIAMLDCDDSVIVSPAYVVFEVIDEQALLPEYLMMWCSRPEFDRNAWLTTDSSVRGGFSWDNFCALTLPVPSIEKQWKIVKEYQVIVDRILLNQKLSQKLEETAQAIYKHWFVDFEFPMSAEYAASIGKPELEGQPYKSSGGGVFYCKEFGKEVPKVWECRELKELAKINGGKRLPIGEQLRDYPTSYPYIKVADMGSSKFVCLNNYFQYVDPKVYEKIKRYTVESGNIIISIVGTIGIVRIVEDSLNGANLTENCARISKLKRVNADYIYHYLYSKVGREEIQMRTVGGVQGKLPLYNIGTLNILIPCSSTIKRFSEIVASLNEMLSKSVLENGYLTKMSGILLSRISTLQ
jgi:type I restriction enzyme, S subunit